MPEVVVTPAQLRWTGGGLETVPTRVSLTAAALRWTGGFLVAGPGTGTSLSVTTPKLDRIMRQEEIVELSRVASLRYQLLWQRTMEAIEAAFTALSQQVNDNTAIIAEIRAAQQLAQAANANADAVSAQLSLANSYVTPQPLSASSDGTITIAAHNRVYGDVSVSVNAGSISGFAQGTFVEVFYEDAARAGGSVTYQGTTGLVAQEGATHIVGGVEIPAAGQPPVPGATPQPPGYVPRREFEEQPV